MTPEGRGVTGAPGWPGLRPRHDRMTGFKAPAVRKVEHGGHYLLADVGNPERLDTVDGKVSNLGHRLHRHYTKRNNSQSPGGNRPNKTDERNYMSIVSTIAHMVNK
eukprot:jgi/Chrzof1/1450/Cz10g08120.t1